MISIYKNQEFALEKISDYTPNSWINMVDPTPEEIEEVAALGIPKDFITYPLDLDERPRIEEEDNGTVMIVVRSPIYNGDDSDVPYGTIPIGIILAEKYIITVCRQKNNALNIFESGKASKLSTTKRYRFSLRILMSVTTIFLDDVRAINKEVDLLEDKLFDSMRNNELVILFKYQKSFVYFTQALKQNELTLVRLTRLKGFQRFDEDEDLLQDVITENTQAVDMTNISSSILASMMESFASIISNNLNVVMKFLASVTIVMEIPNIITGFLGMNVNFPDIIAENPHIGFGVMLLMVMIMIICIMIFNKKNWF